MIASRIVGIAGGSGSGKTTLATALVERFHGAIVDLDSYYVDRMPGTSGVNYDVPAAFDVPLLVEHLRALRDGCAVQKPIYCFRTHRRIGADMVSPASLIIVEGLFPFFWESVRTLMDLKVFVDAPADLRLLRRLRRDVVERGRTADDVLEQYLRTVRPMHTLHVEPARRQADVVIVNEESIDHRIDELVHHLSRIVGEPSPTSVA